MSGTVLIVDDDPEAVRPFADWLQLQGYEVRTASDGKAAWPHVRGVDAILLDARMPILDGLGFLRRLRADGEDVPVAIVTGDYLIDDAVLNEFQRLNAQIVFNRCGSRTSPRWRHSWSTTQDPPDRFHTPCGRPLCRNLRVSPPRSSTGGRRIKL